MGTVHGSHVCMAFSFHPLSPGDQTHIARLDGKPLLAEPFHCSFFVIFWVTLWFYIFTAQKGSCKIHGVNLLLEGSCCALKSFVQIEEIFLGLGGENHED